MKKARNVAQLSFEVQGIDLDWLVAMAKLLSWPLQGDFSFSSICLPVKKLMMGDFSVFLVQQMEDTTRKPLRRREE